MGGLQRAVFSPDGRWLAAGGFTALRVWDWRKSEKPAVPFKSEYAEAFFSPDSSELFAFGETPVARWHIEQGADGGGVPRLTPLPVVLTSRVFSGQFCREQLILGTRTGVLFCPRTNVTKGTLNSESVGATIALGSPDGRWLAIAKGGWMQFFQMDPWRGRGLRDFGSRVADHAFTPGGEALAVVTAKGVSFLETNRWTTQQMLPLALADNARIVFTPDGQSFWLAQSAREAALYDLRTLRPTLPLPDNVRPLALSADGRYLAVEVEAQRLQVWDLVETRRTLHELGLE